MNTLDFLPLLDKPFLKRLIEPSRWERSLSILTPQVIEVVLNFLTLLIAYED
jgi:hypothetical protein